jgi:hypothetical protein
LILHPKTTKKFPNFFVKKWRNFSREINIDAHSPFPCFKKRKKEMMRQKTQKKELEKRKGNRKGEEKEQGKKSLSFYLAIFVRKRNLK